MPNVDRDGLSAHLPNLRIAIIGAGIGRLATSVALARVGFKNITIHEQTSETAEVSAGIQVAPNFARLLRRWGCLDRLQKDAIALEANSLRRYSDDAELGASPFMPGVEQRWGAPLFVVHRADVQRLLLEYANELGVDIETGRHVDDVDFGVVNEEAEAPLVSTPRVYLKNCGEQEGQWVEADVILAADGIRSSTRAAMMKRHGHVDLELSGQLFARQRRTQAMLPIVSHPSYRSSKAYQFGIGNLITRSKPEDDPELLRILDEPIGCRWMGPGGHIMAYPLREHQLYNMVLLHPGPW